MLREILIFAGAPAIAPSAITIIINIFPAINIDFSITIPVGAGAGALGLIFFHFGRRLREVENGHAEIRGALGQVVELLSKNGGSKSS